MGDIERRSRLGWMVLRLTLAGLLAAHGWMRLLGGGIAPFGEWLGTQGVAFGPVVSALITAFEIAGTFLLAIGRLVFPVALIQSLILAAGIAMVHSKSGWFVVGAGRNGAEYSVLLIVALLCLAWQHAPRRKS